MKDRTMKKKVSDVVQTQPYSVFDSFDRLSTCPHFKKPTSKAGLVVRANIQCTHHKSAPVFHDFIMHFLDHFSTVIDGMNKTWWFIKMILAFIQMCNLDSVL